MHLLEKLLHKLICALPGTCIVCGLAANRRWSICQDCEWALPQLGACCRRCGIELNGRLSADGCCPSCLRSPPSFDSCTAAFPYASPINKLVADFKFSARFDIGFALSRILAQVFNAYYLESTKPQLILPVPLHSSRLRSRGFNQAAEIAKVLSRHCGVCSSSAALIKFRNTQPQTSMRSAKARKVNLRGAFGIGSKDSLKAVNHIALVDDVVTTMATVETLSRMLRQQQGCRIDVWCLARASR
jgi:ComF family protein